MAVHGICYDNHEFFFVQLGNGEVGFQFSICIEPWGIGDLANRAVDFVGGDVIQDLACITSLDHELRHERHVHEDDAFPGSFVFCLPVVKPFFFAPGVLFNLRFFAFRRKPIRTFPSGYIFKICALIFQAVIDGTLFGTAGGFHRFERIVAFIDFAK